MLSRRRLLIWAAGLVVYTVLLVLVGSVLLAFGLVPPWGEEGAFGWLSGGLGELRNIRWCTGPASSRRPELAAIF